MHDSAMFPTPPGDAASEKIFANWADTNAVNAGCLHMCGYGDNI